MSTKAGGEGKSPATADVSPNPDIYFSCIVIAAVPAGNADIYGLTPQDIDKFANKLATTPPSHNKIQIHQEHGGPVIGHALSLYRMNHNGRECMVMIGKIEGRSMASKYIQYAPLSVRIGLKTYLDNEVKVHQEITHFALLNELPNKYTDEGKILTHSYNLSALLSDNYEVYHLQEGAISYIHPDEMGLMHSSYINGVNNEWIAGR